MNKEIENYLSTNYYQLYNIAMKMTKQDPLTRDLLHEVILQLYGKEEIKLTDYDDNSIKYYIVAVMRINYFSKTSPFHYRIRRERQIMNVDVASCWDLSYQQEEFEQEQIYQLLELNYSELSWFQKSLMDLYLSLNRSMKAVSRKTNIPNQSISRYINEIRKQVKTDIINKINN